MLGAGGEKHMVDDFIQKVIQSQRGLIVTPITGSQPML